MIGQICKSNASSDKLKDAVGSAERDISEMGERVKESPIFTFIFGKNKSENQKEKYEENQFYFAISFSTGQTEWVNNKWGGREVYSPNPNFENLKETVQKSEIFSLLEGINYNTAQVFQIIAQIKRGKSFKDIRI